MGKLGKRLLVDQKGRVGAVILTSFSSENLNTVFLRLVFLFLENKLLIEFRLNSGSEFISF